MNLSKDMQEIKNHIGEMNISALRGSALAESSDTLKVMID